MSQDAQIAHACPHYIRYERVFLQGGRVIETESPISGQGLLEVRRDGVILPSTGLQSESQVVFYKSGPYRVKTGANTLTVDGQVIAIPTKTYTVEELVKFLSEKLKTTHKVSVFSQSVSISSYNESLSVEGDVLSTSFGFPLTSFTVHSKKITPSWKLSKISGEQSSIIFSRELDPVGLLDVSYTTEKRFCRRCSSTGIENDLRLDSYGNVSLVRDHDLLYQIVAKALLTEIGSNPYHDWYGSKATSLIGQKVNTAVVQAIREAVQQSLDRVIDVQKAQSSVQTVTAKETLSRVDNVIVESVGDDPTTLLCTVGIRSASSEPVTVSVIFAVPGSIPLDGDLT